MRCLVELRRAGTDRRRLRRRRIRGAIALEAGQGRSRLLQHFPARVFDPVDDVGSHLITAVGKGGIADGHLQRTQFSRAQRQRQIIRQLRFVEAEASHIVPGVLAADGAHQAHRDQISRMHQCIPQPNGAGEPVLALLRPPRLLHARLIDDDGRIEHNARRSEPLVERRRVNEGFEARPRLTPRLRHPIEFALKVVKAADQGDHGAVLGIHGDESALRLRHLHEHHRLRGPADRVNHVAAGQDLRCLSRRAVDFLIRQFAPRPGELLPRQRDLAHVPDVDFGGLGVNLLDDGGPQAADHREFLQLGIQLLGGRELGRIDLRGRAAIAVAVIVFQ